MIENAELRQTQITTALDVLRPALPNSTVDLLSEEKSNELIKPHYSLKKASLQKLMTIAAGLTKSGAQGAACKRQL